ncbi:siphovirus Gp157 family protein [Limosilactobacillus sp. RRLNB_1_1]|uniref:Siphovirus Gp157 family protein n=1 Tax=Limosilactobacillus albertensis TaxID=2759752 RepID=A0A7W3TQR1_9LACO|nr:siphovirus Gp157 family protein [Limosilactobacillus albertensis]MBB1069139.1 siphovirus Gp157 family protein [Limosilactobacillus albertensis]MCD7117452.1 siphovirus Gp157 family protein [Limosilactobacillus albertensis]MCD7127924.1 siphovirus Gp157 family protein [Limosilactobacillus albertensis]
MNLFELNDNYKTLANRDDLDPTILKDTLDAIKDDRKNKLDNLATWADRLKSEIEFLDAKQKSWRDEITYRKNKLTWIKKYITDVLDDAGIKKMATENHLLSARNFKASTIIDSDKKLPSKFKITETTIKPDKKAIYDALKAGEKVPGAHLKDNRSTVIK